VTTNFVAGLIAQIPTVSSGMLSVTPKDQDCATPVDPTTRYVDADPTTAGVQELKAWQALLGYVTAFPDTDHDGYPEIPPVPYATYQGRITKN